MNNEQPKLGCAYLFSDGIVRWIVDESKRHNLYLLWLDTEGCWHNGGTVWRRLWQGGTQVPAPQPGDVVQRVTPFGLPQDWTVPNWEESKR